MNYDILNNQCQQFWVKIILGFYNQGRMIIMEIINVITVLWEEGEKRSYTLVHYPEDEKQFMLPYITNYFF